MRTRSVVVLGLTCFVTGALVGVFLRAPDRSHRTLPRPTDPRIVAPATEASRANSDDLEAEVGSLRAAIAAAESECSSRFTEAGCIEHLAWPAGSDPVLTARRIEDTLRSCPTVDPDSIHVECDEYPCGVVYIVEQSQVEGYFCPAFGDLQTELSRGQWGGLALAGGDRRAHITVFMPPFDASPEVMDAATRRSDARMLRLRKYVPSLNDDGE